MLRASLQRRLGERAVVATAGVLPAGRPVDDRAVDALARLGHDVGDHVSAKLDRDAIRRADLILCMERRHQRDVVVIDRDAFARTFTVRELVRRGEGAGPREHGERLESWLARLHEGRDISRLTADAPDDDIADPTGGPAAGYDHTARWLEGLAARLVALAWPPGVDDEDLPLDDEPEPGAGPVARHDVTMQERPKIELWQQPAPDAVKPTRVGILSDRAGVRLARGVEGTLQAMGYGMYGLADDAWVATSWTACAIDGADAIADGDIDVAVLLVESSTGPAALANRRRGVRALAATDVTSARRARRRWGANVLCLGVDEVTLTEAVEITHAFMTQLPTVAPELDDGRTGTTEAPPPG